VTLNVMVWRIQFSEDDLARIQVSPTMGPLAETVLAVALLRCPQQPRTMLSEWRGQVLLTQQMRPLTALLPPGCHGVDLPTLTGEKATIEQGLQALLDVPRDHLLVEMEYTDRRHRLSALAWAMAEAGGRGELAEAAQAAYHELVRPFWPRVRACLHAEQAARHRTLARQGPGTLLTSLQGPRIRWRPPVLEILMPGNVAMELAGRGLALVPSVFVGKDPSTRRCCAGPASSSRAARAARCCTCSRRSAPNCCKPGKGRAWYGAALRLRPSPVPEASCHGTAPGSEWTTGCGIRFKHPQRGTRRQSLSTVP
jgi:hypothetical protein